MKNKKAISPLIATVLIIGFTIVLAAVVIQWGGQLIDKIKGQTDVSSDVSLICSGGLSQLSISGDVSQSAAKLTKVVIDNTNDQEIEGFLFRVYDGTGGINVVDTRTTPSIVTGTLPLAAFGVGTYTFTATAIATDLGVIPIIKSSADGKSYPCSGKELKKAVTQIP